MSPGDGEVPTSVAAPTADRLLMVDVLAGYCGGTELLLDLRPRLVALRTLGNFLGLAVETGILCFVVALLHHERPLCADRWKAAGLWGVG